MEEIKDIEVFIVEEEEEEIESIALLSTSSAPSFNR